MRARQVLVLLAVAGLAAGCEFPRDASGTLERVREATVRVGYTDVPPYVRAGGREPGGVEPALVRGLARELGARVEWIEGSESALVQELHEGRLDLVVAGLPQGSTWEREVALTRPYLEKGVPGAGRDAKKPRVLAVRGGENAWLVEVERYLLDHRDEARALLERELARDAGT